MVSGIHIFHFRTIWKPLMGREAFCLLAPEQRTHEVFWPCHAIRMLVGVTMISIISLSGRCCFLYVVGNKFRAFTLNQRVRTHLWEGKAKIQKQADEQRVCPCTGAENTHRVSVQHIYDHSLRYNYESKLSESRRELYEHQDGLNLHFLVGRRVRAFIGINYKMAANHRQRIAAEIEASKVSEYIAHIL